MHVSYSCTYSFDDSFASFANFSTISKVKEKGCFGQKFYAFKILFELEQFFTCLKNDYSNFKAKTEFFSLLHTQIRKFCLQLMDTFFHCLNTFPGFSSQSNSHSKYLFLILRNVRFQTRFYMWIVTSLKRTIR